MDAVPQHVYNYPKLTSRASYPESKHIKRRYCIWSRVKISGGVALVLMVETESRNTDKDQSTDQSPSAANVVLNTLGPPPLLACDCFLGWHLTKSVHTNTLFDLFVSLTRAAFPQSVKNVPPTTLETESFRESSRTICLFFFFIKIFWSFLLSKRKKITKQKWIWLKWTFLCLKIAETWQRTGQEH